MKQLTIKRKEWLRGSFSEKFSNTAMAASAVNALCCLGHYCNKIAGIPLEYLFGCSTPAEVYDKLMGEGTHCKYDISLLITKDGGDSPFSENAMVYNDDGAFSSERESALIEHFADHGIELTFVD